MRYFPFALLSLFERLALFFFSSSSDILGRVYFASGKNKISHFLFSCIPFDVFTCCSLFFLPLFPLFVCCRQYLACSRSTSNASRTHLYLVRTFKLFHRRCGCSYLCQGRCWRATVLVHRDHARDFAWIGGDRRGPGSPTHPHRSAVMANAYEKANATTLRELSKLSPRSDHVFNELIANIDLDTFVLAGRNWHLLASSSSTRCTSPKFVRR